MLIDDCFPYLYITRNVSFAQWIYKEIHNRILISFHQKNPKDRDRKIFVNNFRIFGRICMIMIHRKSYRTEKKREKYLYNGKFSNAVTWI